MKFNTLRSLLNALSKLGPGLALTIALLVDPSASSYAQEAPLPSGEKRASAPSGAVGGMGDINLFPKRIVIDARQRIASVGLYNKSTSAGDYEIIISDKMMTQDGQLIDLGSIEDPAQRARVKTASAFLRWSPRRVQLPGSEAQTVRIMARPAPDLQPGEYRSHFTAISVPPPEDPGDLSEDGAGQGAAKAIGVRIVPRFGISIPVIVRIGATTLSVSLADVSLIKQGSTGRGLAITILRQGTRSAFGDLAVFAPGNRKPIAELKGVGVYPELDQRTVFLPLDAKLEPRQLASGTKLSITFTDDDYAPGQVLARQTYTVP